MRSIFFFILLVTFFTTNLACKKYLEKKSNDALVVPQTLNDLQGLLDDAVYMNSATPSLQESSADDYFLPESTARSMPTGYQQIYTWDFKNYNYQNDWSLSYLPVFNANVCLETLPSILKDPNNEAQWSNIKGSALFFRAFHFLNLCWQHAKGYDKNTSSMDLGIVLRLGADFNVKSRRSTVKECYDRIINDTKESILFLPEIPLHVMRPSKAAAYGLLARTYLSMRVYDSSLKYSNLSLLSRNDLMEYSGDEGINGGVDAPTPFKKFNKETIFYTEMNRSVPLHGFSNGFVDTTLYSLYDNNDLRKEGYFVASGENYKFKGTYSANRNILFSGIAIDEMYLIRAESFARVGKVMEAMNDLNKLMRTRWSKTVSFTPFVANNRDDAIEIILKERRKELLYRGLRWIDIKRLNKEGFEIIPVRKFGAEVYNLPPNDNRYALPIPTDIINQTGIKQN